MELAGRLERELVPICKQRPVRYLRVLGRSGQFVGQAHHSGGIVVLPRARVLAITFTTAAAATLRQRVSGVVGQDAKDVSVTTFHALGLRLIKQWSGELGFGDYLPAVYGRDDARALLREVATQFGLELAADVRGQAYPWAVSLAKLDQAVERFRLGWTAANTTCDRDDLDEELLLPLSDAYEALSWSAAPSTTRRC